MSDSIIKNKNQLENNNTLYDKIYRDIMKPDPLEEERRLFEIDRLKKII